MAVVKFSNGYEWHTGELTRATNDVYGVVKLATADDVRNGTNDYKAVTPIILNEVFDEKILEIKETGLSYDDITNCLTEIPQDIKLELVDGTLTLKAGSKVYVPNGFEADGTTPKFDEIVIGVDISGIRTSSNTQEFLFYGINNSLNFWTHLYSGNTAPSEQLQHMIWYDTTTNFIKYTTDYGSTWNISGFSLPLCRYTQESSQTTSIDQVFNGFGYIGSTIFVLPRLKGLAPNGRNEDGKMINQHWAVENVIIRTFSNDNIQKCVLALNPTEPINGYLIGKLDNDFFVYDDDKNINLNIGHNEDGSNEWRYTPIATMTLTNGVVSDFNPKTVFHLTDYNDFKRLDGETVKLFGDQEINGAKTFNSTVNISNNMSIRSYGSNDSGRLQIRAQPSDNVIRGTFAITDAYEGYDGWVSQMVSRSGDLSTDGFNTLRVSEKGVEYIREEPNGDVISNHKLLDTSVLTNCITEIPQDIKLELVDGTLTLKAGSKVYVPNGFEADGVTPKFDVVVIESDLSSTYNIARKGRMFVDISTNNLTHSEISNDTSGATDPSIGTGSYRFWYDTANNRIRKYESDSTVPSDKLISLPILIYTSTTSGYTSIDQVYNGFGYIGSTIFALPGVKGLIPNGRNEDGTLKNIEINSTKVLTYSENTGGNRYIMLTSNTLENFVNVFYDREKNILYNFSNPQIVRCVCGKFFRENDGKITSFVPKTVFRATDYNDFKQLDEEFVKLDGDQDIGGNKNFTREIKRSSALGANGSYAIRTVDTNGKGETSLVSYYAGENIYNRLLAKNATSGKVMYLDVISKDNGTAEIGLGGSATSKYVNLHGSTKVRVPTAGSSAESTEAVNVSYLNSKAVLLTGDQDIGGDKNFTGTLTQNGNTVATTNNTVNLTGNQTINDVKTFLNAPTIKTTVADSRITTKNESFKIGETVSENSYSGFKGVDADGTEYANCNCSYNTSGRVGCNFYVKRSDSGTLVEGSLGIYIDKNGTSAYTSAPTPAISDNSTKISTTNWFNQKIQVVSTLPASPNSNVYYFVTG